MKLLNYLFLSLFVITMSCSTDSNPETDNTVPAIVDLINHVPDTSLDNEYRGKYSGVFGHYRNSDLHGKIYVNVGMDTRYSAVIEMVDGSLMNFKGTPLSKGRKKVIQFEGVNNKKDSFLINFTDFDNPEITNVYMAEEEDPGYIVLVKARGGITAFTMMGSFVDSADGTFSGNWDVIGDIDSSTNTQFSFPITVPFPTTVTGNALSQEIVILVISRPDNTHPITLNDPDDFDMNTSVACVPAGIIIPATEPVLVDINITGPIPLGYVGRAMSAGGQTSTILGSTNSWTLNYNPAVFTQPEGYLAENCSATTSGSWNWMGRTGTITVIPAAIGGVIE